MDRLKAVKCKHGYYVILTESYPVNTVQDVTKIIAHYGLQIVKPEQEGVILAEKKYKQGWEK